MTQTTLMQRLQRWIDEPDDVRLETLVSVPAEKPERHPEEAARPLIPVVRQAES